VIPTPPPTKTKTKPTVTLEECIDLFSSAEELEPVPSDESPSSRRCYRCGSEEGFTKGIKLGELPEVLCVHLKRFRWKLSPRASANGVKQKVDTLVRFPLEGLDLSRWLGEAFASDESSGEASDESSGEASDEDGGGGRGGGKQLYELYAVVVHQGQGTNSGHYSAFVKTADDEWWSINDERAARTQPEQVARAKPYLLFYRRQGDV
jgi:ubiquitin C-terminal hydrolase